MHKGHPLSLNVKHKMSEKKNADEINKKDVSSYTPVVFKFQWRQSYNYTFINTFS